MNRFKLVMDRVEKFGYSRTALVVTLVIVLAVIVARYYYSFVTGYIIPDEAYYYDGYVLDKVPIGSYRDVFVAVFLLFFSNVKDVWQFLIVGFVYSAVWATGTIAVAYKLVRRLETSDKVAALLLLSLPLFPVFLVMAPTILTEPPALFFGLLGAYFTLRYIQAGNVANAFLSGSSFILASEIREPYFAFSLGIILLYLILLLMRRVTIGGLLAYGAAVSVDLPVPVGFQPLQLAFPVRTLLTRLALELNSWIHSVYSPSSTSNPPPMVNSTLAKTTLAHTIVTSSTSNPPPMVNVLASQLRLKMPAASQYISLSNLQSLTTGLAYGYNPIFAAFALISLAGAVYMVYRTRSPRYLFLSLNTLLALSTFVISTTYIAASFPGAASFFFSGVIRATHTSLPSFIGFGGIYRRLRPKRVVGLMLVLIIAGSTQIPTLTAAFQKSLSVEPVDRVSLSYRAPYYRLYLLAKDAGKTLVIGGMHMRGIRMYMAMLPNVVLIGPPKDNATLQALLDQGWDAVFLYDDWITIKVPSMIHGYPQFYQNILTTGHYPGYTIETIWIDGESYALKMVKVNGASDVSDEMRISIMSGQTCAARVAGQNKDSTTCPAIGRYKLAPIEETPIQMRMGSPSFE